MWNYLPNDIITPSSLYYPLLALILSLSVFAIRKYFYISGLPSSIKVKTSSTPTSVGGKTRDRKPGEWTPVAFEYPDILACKEDWKNIKPIPYRPFKWGDYHVTMGIRSMPWNEWIELDKQFVDYHHIRVNRMKTRGKRVVQTLPEKAGIVGSGYPAAVELVHELAEYLSRRYPLVYTVTRHAPGWGSFGWYGLGQIKDITVVPLDKTFELDQEDPMTLSALLVQEDLAIMVEGTDGRYYLQAGAVCIAGTWRMEDKMGMPLDEIHISGRVPQFETKLNLSMGRFFQRMGVDKPVVRNNYTFQVVPVEEKQGEMDPNELSWAGTMKGDEDVKESDGERWLRGIDEHDENTCQSRAGLEESGRMEREDGVIVRPSTVWLRTERQTLRRLPRTGGIVFTIRVYQTSVEELCIEAGVPGRMASAIRSWPEEVARYKAKAAYEGILEYLDEGHRKQVASGKNDQAASYPF